MTKQDGLKKIVTAINGGNYSDTNATSLERGVEFGFGLVLGVSAAVLIMVLLFFTFKSMIL